MGLSVDQTHTHPTMRAIGARQTLPTTSPDCLIEFETDMPSAGPLDVIVQIAAVGVNPVDTKIRSSLGSEPMGTPRILGWDAAGTIVSVGSAVEKFQPGDEVFYAGDLTRPGSNAEFQAVDSRLIAKKPPSWTFAEAAALPLVTLTAWELLFERMGVSPTADSGKTLLIINGSGGVGSAMIPLAISAGLQVVVTASREETRAWCRNLGATLLLNHREPLRPQAEALGISEFSFIANLHDTDAYWKTTADLIAPLGTIGLIVEPKGDLSLGDPLKAKCVRIAWEFMAARAKFQTSDMHRQGEILHEIAARCEAGTFPKLNTHTFSSITAAHLREAHQAMEKSSAIGKWVLQNFKH